MGQCQTYLRMLLYIFASGSTAVVGGYKVAFPLLKFGAEFSRSLLNLRT